MANEHTENFWSVIISGGRYYLGNVIGVNDGDSNELIVQPCYEVTTQLIPMGMSNGRPVISKNISAEPILCSFDESPVHLKYTGMVKFETMESGDKARYKRLADSAAKMALEARAAEANIVLGGKTPSA